MSAKSTNQQALVVRILWAAMLVSQFVIGFVAFQVKTQRTTPPSDELSTITTALGGVAIAATVMVFLVFPKLFAKTIFVLILVRLAFAEMVGIFGIALASLGASTNVIGGFIAASVFLVLVHFPSNKEMTLLEEQVKR
jgi:hypothetical protein